MHRKTLKLILKRASLYTTLLLITALLTGCEQPVKQYDYSIFAFGTLIDITLYDVDEDQASAAFELLQNDFDHYQQHWSPWTNGDLAHVNQALDRGKAIPLPDHLIPLIDTSFELSQQSENFYNPTIGKLINLWQFHKYQEENIQPPDHRQIQGLVMQKPQMSDLTLDADNRLASKNQAVSLNFGAFAKGYAIEQEIRQLQNLNIHNAVINAGGDLSVIGQHGDRHWNIGIRHPRKSSIMASIEVNHDESVFTSGDYERYYEHMGVRYHHILDPRTGYPTNDSQSVTVLHHDPGRADAAATAIFVAGSKNWQRIAKNMGIDHVMLVDAGGNIHLTPAMKKRIKLHPE